MNFTARKPSGHRSQRLVIPDEVEVSRENRATVATAEDQADTAEEQTPADAPDRGMLRLQAADTAADNRPAGAGRQFFLSDQYQVAQPEPPQPPHLPYSSRISLYILPSPLHLPQGVGGSGTLR